MLFNFEDTDPPPPIRESDQPLSWTWKRYKKDPITQFSSHHRSSLSSLCPILQLFTLSNKSHTLFLSQPQLVNMNFFKLSLFALSLIGASQATKCNTPKSGSKEEPQGPSQATKCIPMSGSKEEICSSFSRAWVAGRKYRLQALLFLTFLFSCPCQRTGQRCCPRLL